MIAWLFFVLAVAALLTLGVEWLLRRHRIRRVNPESGSAGLGELVRLIRERRDRRDPHERGD